MAACMYDLDVPVIKNRVRLDRNDQSPYHYIRQNSLVPFQRNRPNCHLEMGLMVNSLNAML